MRRVRIVLVSMCFPMFVFVHTICVLYDYPMSEHIGHMREARGRCGPINPLIILLPHPSLMGGEGGGACQHVVDTRGCNG